MTFPFKKIAEKNVIVLEIPEKLNLDNSEELRLLIKEKVDDGYYRLIFDMTKTNYVDSTGLGAIVSRIAFVRSNQGDIRLAIQSDFVKELLDITNLNKILKYFDTVEEAVNSFD